MTGYASIMVQAYSRASGKSIQESFVDLGIDGLIDLSEITSRQLENGGLILALQEDGPGVLSWGHDNKK